MIEEFAQVGYTSHQVTELMIKVLICHLQWHAEELVDSLTLDREVLRRIAKSCSYASSESLCHSLELFTDQVIKEVFDPCRSLKSRLFKFDKNLSLFCSTKVSFLWVPALSFGYKEKLIIIKVNHTSRDLAGSNDLNFEVLARAASFGFNYSIRLAHIE